jgi:DNA-directed RNA polymerase specialized sigma24 family protein
LLLKDSIAHGQYVLMRRALHVVPSPVANPDADAFARIGRGDLSALGELYDRYARDLFQFAKRAAPDDDAEDVVHVVFERLVRISVSYDGQSVSPRSWLFGVAESVLRERRRSVRRLAMAVASRLRGPQMKPALRLVQRVDRTQLDDFSLRRLRHRAMASADATLRAAPATRSGTARLIAAVALTSAFAVVLGLRPRLEYAHSSAELAPRAPPVRIQLAAPITPHAAAPPPIPSSVVPERDSPVPARHREPRRRKATSSSTTDVAPSTRGSADGDGAEEDLAYLRVLALVEERRNAEAVLAARAYLERFPEGFRRVEVRSIALGP